MRRLDRAFRSLKRTLNCTKNSLESISAGSQFSARRAANNCWAAGERADHPAATGMRGRRRIGRLSGSRSRDRPYHPACCFNSCGATLTGLPAIKLLSVSTDVYHQKFVPLENIKNAVHAISALNRIFNIAVCTDTEENVEFKQIVHDLNEIGVGDKIRVSITYPAGRARLKGSCHSYPVAHEPTPGACQVASSPVIYPDGRVISCIGPLLTLPITHPMFLGNLHQECLNDILYRSELNHVLHTIRVWGPYKLVSLLQQNKSIELPEEYICNCPCDVCYKVFSHPGAYEALMTIFGDQRLQHSVAYARLHYLNESALVEHYRL